MSVDLHLKVVAPSGRTREISGALDVLARRARQDAACVSSEAYASLDDPNHLVLHEKWKSEDDLACYVRSDDFTQMLTLFEMAAEPPAIEFRLDDRTCGLNYAAAVRGLRND